MNKVLLVGYLANDPKERITTKGIEQSNFDIALHDLRNYEESYFFSCVAWGQQAKYCNSNLKKGSLVCIDGRLTKRSYVNNEGKTVYLTEIVVDSLRHLLTNKSANYSNTIDMIKNNNEQIDKVFNIDEILNKKSDPIEEKSTDNSEPKKFDWEDEID